MLNVLLTIFFSLQFCFFDFSNFCTNVLNARSMLGEVLFTFLGLKITSFKVLFIYKVFQSIKVSKNKNLYLYIEVQLTRTHEIFLLHLPFFPFNFSLEKIHVSKITYLRRVLNYLFKFTNPNFNYI